jgi:PAS domain S-box-containing protein
VTGVVTIQSYRSATIYNRTDLELLNAVSHHIALAIERKESEACLARQNQLLEKILEASPVGIACLENQVFKWVNTEMVRMFGYESKDAFENKPVKMLYSSTMDCDASLKALHADLMSAGKAEQDITLVKGDDSRFPASIRMNSSDQSDTMARTIAIFTDISQKIATEKELCEKERLQGVLEMAGAVCHELNQPLQAILGYTELLLMNQGGNRDTNLYAIKTQAGRIETIARKLSTVTCYKTIDYPGNTKIVDIWHSGSSH